MPGKRANKEKHMTSFFGNVPVKVASGIKLTAENKCSFCAGRKCCQYITQGITAPRSKEDFEHLLWQVSHQHISVYKDNDGWCLLIDGVCTHLRPNGACGIYENRPQVCRDYSNDYCEFDAPAEEGFDLFFSNYEALLKYCKKRFKRWERG